MMNQKPVLQIRIALFGNVLDSNPPPVPLALTVQLYNSGHLEFVRMVAECVLAIVIARQHVLVQTVFQVGVHKDLLRRFVQNAVLSNFHRLVKHVIILAQIRFGIPLIETPDVITFGHIAEN